MTFEELKAAHVAGATIQIGGEGWWTDLPDPKFDAISADHYRVKPTYEAEPKENDK